MRAVCRRCTFSPEHFPSLAQLGVRRLRLIGRGVSLHGRSVSGSPRRRTVPRGLGGRLGRRLLGTFAPGRESLSRRLRESLAADRRLAVLLAAGVPPGTILLNGTAASTWEEAQAVAQLLYEKGWRSVLVVSDPPHLKRLKWVFRKVFRNSPIRVGLISSGPAWWNRYAWRTDPGAAAFVFSEIIKLSYYRIKFRNDSAPFKFFRFPSVPMAHTP